MSDFENLYRQKLTTPEQAVAEWVRDGELIALGCDTATPARLLAALCDFVLTGDGRRLHVQHALDFSSSRYYENIPAMREKGLTAETMFMTGLMRKSVLAGQAEYQSIHLSSGYRLMGLTRRTSLMMITVPPMDENGCFSVGLSNVWTSSILENLPDCRLILEVNPNMPYTLGTQPIPLSRVNAIVESNEPLPFAPPPGETDEKDVRIAAHIAELIPNGATIQIGIGGVPGEVAKQIADKHDLGVHTEMFNDAIMELYKSGAINNSKKNYMPGLMVTSFCFGRPELYDFLRENRDILRVMPASVTNDPYTAGKNDDLCSVNGTMAVDIYGQCASEGVGGRQYSCTGGQLDFIRATHLSKNGKSFLTCHSTYTDREGKEHSKICLFHEPGTVVTVPRSDVMYIVTEYGCVNLFGHSASERAKRVISVAHPAFRDELTYQAKKYGIMI